MTTRDIASAFSRILLRPDLIHIFTTDIEGGRIGRSLDVFMWHLSMPFGWVASPAYFKLHTGAITDVNNYFRPSQAMSGRGLFTSYVYVDDCMLIECPVGNLFECLRNLLGMEQPENPRR